MSDGSRRESRRVRVMLVDDHPIVREGVRRRIEAQPDMEVCREAASAAEALRDLDRCPFDVGVVDISLAGRSGIDLIKDIRARGIESPVIVLSVHDDVTYVERALAAGAQGYVLKQEAPQLIIEAMRRVLAGEIFVSSRMISKLMSRFVGTEGWSDRRPIDSLSDREIEVLEGIGGGRSTRQIAGALGLSVSTVETYKTRLKEKLDLKSAAELAAFAAKWVGGTRA